MDKLKRRAEKYKNSPSAVVEETKDMSVQQEEIPKYLVMTTAPEFYYDERDSTLYWINNRSGSDKMQAHRLANFKVVIKRRYNLIVGRYVYERVIVMLRGKVSSVDIDIFTFEYGSLIQSVKKNPGYFLYPDLDKRTAIFEQYISEVWETINTMTIERVYQESGWHLNEFDIPHYYSGIDVNYCLSKFLLADIVSAPRDLIEWGIGLLSMGAYEVMLPLLIHAHLGYTLKLFEEIGYREQYILLMIGESGSGKTTLARIMFTLFETKNEKEIDPIKGLVNFTSTDKAIELDMMKRQDSTLVIDDLCKGKNELMLEKFERVLRQLGDSTGRKTTKNGGTEQVEVETNCAVILTAESDIDMLGKSSKLRTLAVNIDKMPFNKSAVDVYKRDADEAYRLKRFSKLEQYMTMYIHFLENHYPQVIQSLLAEREIAPPVQFNFLRQLTIFIMMRSQLKLILDFWRLYFPVSDYEYFDVYNRYVNILASVIKENELRIIEVEPYIIFLQIVKHIISTSGVIAPDKITFSGSRLGYNGYWDNGNLIIMSDWLYSVIINEYWSYYRKPFPEKFKSILKKLHAVDLIEVYEQKDHAPKYLKQVKIENVNLSVICLRWQTVETILNQTVYI